MMGAELFIVEEGKSLFVNGKVGEINNKFGEMILSLSINHPIAYGFFSIILVVLFGILFSYAREFVHYVRYDLDKKKYSFFK